MRFLRIFGDIESKSNCKKKCQAQKPEELEVYPNIHAEAIGDSQIDKTDDDEKAQTEVLNIAPGVLRQSDARENFLNVILLREASEKKDRGKEPIQKRGLPLNEGGILKGDRHAAEKHHEKR